MSARHAQLRQIHEGSICACDGALAILNLTEQGWSMLASWSQCANTNSCMSMCIEWYRHPSVRMDYSKAQHGRLSEGPNPTAVCLQA